MQQLADYIKSKIRIRETDLQIVLSAFEKKTFSKGTFVLSKGEIANQYFYVKSGGLRFYYGDYKDETTAWVFFEDDFLTEISSLNPQIPTRFNIEAIEQTELIVINKTEMEKLYQQIPVWQEFGRKIWEGILIRQTDHMLKFQTLSAEEMYLEFMKTPDFLQKIPLKQLASVLGITSNSLSRIRKNIK
jgi:CRP-like cAMP-binding protein